MRYTTELPPMPPSEGGRLSEGVAAQRNAPVDARDSRIEELERSLLALQLERQGEPRYRHYEDMRNDNNRMRVNTGWASADELEAFAMFLFGTDPSSAFNNLLRFRHYQRLLREQRTTSVESTSLSTTTTTTATATTTTTLNISSSSAAATTTTTTTNNSKRRTNKRRQAADDDDNSPRNNDMLFCFCKVDKY